MAATDQGERFVRVEEGRARLVAGINVRLTSAGRDVIPQLWSKLEVPEAGTPGVVPGAWYGVCHSPGEDGSFEYLCGVEYIEKAAIPDGAHSVCLPRAKYAVVSHDEHISHLPQTWRYMLDIWFPAHPECKLADTPQFELYGLAYDPKSGFGGCEIWFPLRGAIG